MTPILTAVINRPAEEVEELLPDPLSVEEGKFRCWHCQEIEPYPNVFILDETLKYQLPPWKEEICVNINDVPNTYHLWRPGNSYIPVGVYSLNNQGLTARDPLHREERAGNPFEARYVTEVNLLLPENSTREKKTLLEKRAVTVTPLPPPPGGVHLDEMNAQVAIMVVFAATSVGILCSIPASVSTGDAGGIVFEAADVLTGRVPRLLYLVVFNTVVVGFSLGVPVKQMWKLPFKQVLLFVSITSCFVYALLVDRVIPKFWVRIGSLNVVSSAMVWLLSGAYVASAAIAYYAVSYGFPYLKRLIKSLNSKTKRGLRCPGDGNILPMTV